MVRESTQTPLPTQDDRRSDACQKKITQIDDQLRQLAGEKSSDPRVTHIFDWLSSRRQTLMSEIGIQSIDNNQAVKEQELPATPFLSLDETIAVSSFLVFRSGGSLKTRQKEETPFDLSDEIATVCQTIMTNNEISDEGRKNILHVRAQGIAKIAEFTTLEADQQAKILDTQGDNDAEKILIYLSIENTDALINIAIRMLDENPNYFTLEQQKILDKLYSDWKNQHKPQQI